MKDTQPRRFVLRDLPVVPRVVLAIFLMSVGFGYFSALVQLHFQGASAGRLLPSASDAVTIYNGRPQLSQLERVLTADESRPFNGSGSMKPAFFDRSAGWKKHIKALAKEKKLTLEKAEADLREQHNGERLAVLAWIRDGAPQKAYDDNRFPIPANLVDHPITPQFEQKSSDGKAPATVMIRDIFQVRCARCHSEGQGGPAAQFPLDTYEQIHDYCEVETAGPGMSLTKLAETTHVHLLSFSMLYGLTGLIFAFTTYPVLVRLIISPLALLAQLVDISCWWLGRADPRFAQAIVITGGIVGASLFVQIVGSLFNMFGKTGKVVLILLILAGGFGGYVVKQRVIDPYIHAETLRGEAGSD